MGYEEALRLIKRAAETGATWLDLSELGLTSLPPELFELKKLTKLLLWDNQLASLPPEIIQLKNLTVLYLTRNCLTSLPPEIVQLSKLTTLDLCGNQFTCLPPETVHLANLQCLRIGENNISCLPTEIVQLPNLETLYLYNNPLTSPPLEIALQGMDAIRSYFASLEGKSRLLAEVKVILVGEGASGKTSLTRCLRGEQFNAEEETTHGIRIKQWRINEATRPIRCNLWDFGGQEIMRATHQFFLSRRSLYVLVLDGRRDEQPEYWLRYIESFGGGSPVLVVLNKQDANPGFDVDRIALRRKFPFIKGFWQTSCFTGQGVEVFRQALHQELGKVPFIETRWANAWFRVKETLEQMNKPCIGYDEFERICRDAGVKEDISRETLLAFLHDLGIVIHFTEFELEENHVLDPKWVTEGVYAIINAPSLAESKGLLKLRDLREILRFKEGDSYHYEYKDYSYLVGLMKKFELCYELDDERVFIPQLFAVQEPAFAFDDSKALRFVLHYEDFLPASVMPRFIVNRHQEIQGDLRWRNGVVLKNAQLDARAVVRADNETRRIHIAVTGTQRKAFLTVIMLTLREINVDFTGLKVSERVPMPDDPERTADYETLLNYVEEGIEKYIPEGSKKAYVVRELLDTVDEERMLRLLEKAPAGIDDKESLVSVIKKHVKAEPDFFGFGADLKGLAEDLWLRYKAKRG